MPGKSDRSFRKAVNGFNRQDVVAFLQTSAREHREEASALRTTIEQLRLENSDLKKNLDRLKSSPVPDEAPPVDTEAQASERQELELMHQKARDEWQSRLDSANEESAALQAELDEQCALTAALQAELYELKSAALGNESLETEPAENEALAAALQAKLEEQCAETAALQAELEEQCAETAALQAELYELKSAALGNESLVSVPEYEALQAAKEQIRTLTEEMRSLERQNEDLTARVKSMTEQFVALKGDHEALESQYSAREQVVELTRSERDELRTAVSRLEAEIAGLSGRLELAESETETVPAAHLEEARLQIENQYERIKDYERQAAALRNRNAELRNQRRAAAESEAAIQTELAVLRRVAEEKNRELVDMRLRLEDMGDVQSLTGLQAELREKDAACEALTARLDAKTKEYDELRNAVADAEAEVGSLQDFKTRLKEAERAAYRRADAIENEARRNAERQNAELLRQNAELKNRLAAMREEAESNSIAVMAEMDRLRSSLSGLRGLFSAAETEEDIGMTIPVVRDFVPEEFE